MLDADDWVLRFDPRASDRLIRLLQGRLGHELAARCLAHPDLVDLALRREPGGRSTATLRAGRSLLLELREEQGAVAVHGAALTAGPGALDVGALGSPDVGDLSPDAVTALLAAVDRALAAAAEAGLPARERLEVAFAQATTDEHAVLSRGLLPSYVRPEAAALLREELALPVLAALERHRPGALDEVAEDVDGLLGTTSGVLAVDDHGSLRVTEVAAAPGDVERAAVRARFWAELLAAWTADDALARIRLLDALDQRRALGLTALDAELRSPVRIVPVVGLGPEARTAEASASLDALVCLLHAAPSLHAAVQRVDRWHLDAHGRRVARAAVAA
jgi:hypothetical protein